MAKNEYSERFLQVIDALGLKDADVAKNVEGLDKTLMSHIRTGKQGASMNVIASLCKTYESANTEFLLAGRGLPLRENPSEVSSITESEAMIISTEDDYKQAMDQGLKLLPEVSFKFAAGQTEFINDPEFITRYWYLPDCKDCEGVAQIVGNSMSPSYPPGCWVALKRYPFSGERALQIPFGNVFAIVVEDIMTGEYFGHIKILRRYKERELARKYWIAHSINELEFDDFEIEIAQVRSLWIVKQHVVTDILL